jgi:hypothetical protein
MLFQSLNFFVVNPCVGRGYQAEGDELASTLFLFLPDNPPLIFQQVSAQGSCYAARRDAESVDVPSSQS